MKTFILKAFPLIFFSYSATAIAANPFESFIGVYETEKTIESTCTTSGVNGDKWCSKQGLNMLNTLWIYKDSNPKSSTFKEMIMGTAGGNTIWGRSLEEGNVWPGVQQVLTSNGGLTVKAINIFKNTFYKGSSALVNSYEITQGTDGSFQFTYQASYTHTAQSELNAAQKNVYQMKKVK